jgi:hypothetical protein
LPDAWLSRLKASLGLFGTLVLAGCVAPPAPVDYVLPPHATVSGKTLGEYGAEWWQWSLSIPLDDSPVKDLTGEKCARGQTGEVWFLAGTYESRPITRRCTVPQGKHIFFPLINMVYWRSPQRPVSCEAVKEAAALNNNRLEFIEASIDGVDIPSIRSHREESPACFDVFAKVSKEVKAPPGYPAATDGYWIMLKPLPAGRHAIRFRAKYNRPGGAYGDLTQDVSYDLNVTAP